MMDDLFNLVTKKTDNVPVILFAEKDEDLIAARLEQIYGSSVGFDSLVVMKPHLKLGSQKADAIAECF